MLTDKQILTNTNALHLSLNNSEKKTENNVITSAVASSNSLNAYCTVYHYGDSLGPAVASLATVQM